MKRTPLLVVVGIAAVLIVTLIGLRGTTLARPGGNSGSDSGRSELSELRTKLNVIPSVNATQREPTRITAVKSDRSSTNTRSLSGRVTLADGTPLPLATVSTNSGTSATTDAEGKYQIDDLPSQLWRISAAHPDCVTSTVRGLARGQDTLDFILTRKTPVLLVGKVLLTAVRQPLGQFSVDSRQGEVVRSTSEAGKFEIRGLFSGDEISFRIESPGLSPRSIREWIPADASGTMEREYEMGAGGTITGRIVRIGDKSPVAGAGIRSQSFSRRGGNDAATSATSGTDGKFTLSQLSPGQVRLQIFPDAPLVEVSRFVGDIAHGALKDVGDIEVGEGGTIRGKLIKVPGDQPVAGERVDLGGGRGGFGGGDFGGGRGGPGGGFGGGFGAGNFGRGGPGGSQGPGGTSTLAAQSTSTTLQSIAGSLVGAPAAGQGNQAGGGSGGGRNSNTSFTLTASDGSFEFTQVPPNRYQLMVRKYELRESVSMDGEETKKITLRVGDGTLRGLLVKDGNPVRGNVDFARQTGGQTMASAEAGDSGSFTVEGLAPGMWKIDIEPDEGRSVEQDFEMPASGILERTFVLPSGDIVGRVVDKDDQPVPGASIALLTQDTAQAFQSMFGGGGGGGGRRSRGMESGADGTFRLQDRPAGPAALVARKEGLGSSPIIDVAVPESGETAEVILRLGDGLVGTLVSTALNLDTGAPIPDAWCMLTTSKGSINHRQRRGPDGVMTIPDLPAGTYQVQVSARGHTVSEHTVDIREGQKAEITSVIGPAGSIRLSLVDHNGSGVANVQCHLQPNDPNSIESPRDGTSDATGVWTMRGLQPGSYTLTFTRAGGSPMTTVINVDAGGITQESQLLN